MTEFLEFKKDFPGVSCYSCRNSFEDQGRLPPCDAKGRCAYTKDGEEPPTERLSGLSAVAWRLWNTKEALGMEAVHSKLSRMDGISKEIIYELLLHIETEVRRLGLKEPDEKFEGGE